MLRPYDGADLPDILEIFVYLFVHAMTTVSAVVVYSANTALASVAVLNTDDAGDIAPAAAMGMVIFTNIAAGLLHMALSRGVLTRPPALARRGGVTSATRSAGSSSPRLLHCSSPSSRRNERQPTRDRYVGHMAISGDRWPPDRTLSAEIGGGRCHRSAIPNAATLPIAGIRLAARQRPELETLGQPPARM